MKKIKLYNEKDLPQTIYHYTDQKGLLGIIESKSIWATNIFFLNDSSELKYAMNMLEGYFDANLKHNMFKEYDHDQFGLLMELIDMMKTPYNPYLCSFSEEGDLLSQWRGYCPQGSGFSIGFDTHTLKENLKKHSFEISQCEYGPENQNKMISEIVEKYLMKGNKTKDVKKGKSLTSDLVSEFITAFFIIAPKLKDRSFEEEKEWRFSLSLRSSKISVREFKVREGKSMLIPYVVVPLWQEKDHIPIKEIIIGPTPYKELSQIAINNLIENNYLENIEIKHSLIPFRNL